MFSAGLNASQITDSKGKHTNAAISRAISAQRFVRCCANLTGAGSIAWVNILVGQIENVKQRLDQKDCRQEWMLTISSAWAVPAPVSRANAVRLSKANLILINGSRSVDDE